MTSLTDEMHASAREAPPPTPESTIAYLATLPLTDALFWFIENVDDDMPGRSKVFFYLRGRVRMEPTP
jgi:hypothetical protein